MPAQIQPITERQLDLITRAHRSTGGLIEPLLELKGGAKLKLIASLAQRGLIEQQGGQWCLSPAAIAIIKGEAQPEDAMPPTVATSVATPPLADDPELEAAVAAAEASWQQDQPNPAPKRGPGNSKQALVIEMLKRPEGATIAQICEATGWQAHTVRGAFASALKKKLGLTITSEKPEGGDRIYRIQ
jgi:hypothetical protein